MKTKDPKERMRRLLESNVSSICFRQMRSFDICPQEFLETMNDDEAPSASEVVGNLTHAIAEHGKDSRVVSMLIENELMQLPVEQQAEAREQIAKVVANAGEMEKSDAKRQQKKRSEFTYRWYFEAAKCKLAARPDQTNVVHENGEDILEIVDCKKGSSEYLKRKDKDQVFFFGLVVSKALGWTGKIRLIVRYWGNSKDFPIYFSHHRTGQQLREVHAKIEKIRSYIAANSFPTKAGHHCKFCPAFATCEAADRYMSIIEGRYVPPPASSGAAGAVPAKSS